MYELSEENLQSHSFYDKKKCFKSQREEVEELIHKDPHFLHIFKKQAEKLKSREMKEKWMKNDAGWMKKDEGWRFNDEGWWFLAVEGFWFMTDERTNERTDICECRVAFATEKVL